MTQSEKTQLLTKRFLYFEKEVSDLLVAYVPIYLAIKDVYRFNAGSYLLVLDQNKTATVSYGDIKLLLSDEYFIRLRAELTNIQNELPPILCSNRVTEDTYEPR